MDPLNDPLGSAAVAILLVFAALAGWRAIRLLRQTSPEKSPREAG